MAKVIAASGMFASEWYARQSSGDAFSGDLIDHYLKIGSASGLSPHPLFDARWYLARYPDLAAVVPFVHYVTSGAAEGRQPGPLVETQWFEGQRGHAEDAALDPAGVLPPPWCRNRAEHDVAVRPGLVPARTIPTLRIPTSSL